MIYFASDIIKKAELASDLQNSDFLSWYEKTTLLNDAYISLYQKLVNSGDQSFVKRITIGERTKLPCDFWQLKNVYIENGSGTIQVVSRRAPSGSFNSLSYELINNEIRVYGAAAGNIIMEYFIKPKDLTFKPEIDEIETRHAYFISGYGDYILTADAPASSFEIYIENIKTGNVHSTSIFIGDIATYSTVSGRTQRKIVCGKNGFAYKHSGSTDTSVHFYGWDGEEKNTPESADNGSILIRFDNGNVGFMNTSEPHKGNLIEGTVGSKYSSVPSALVDLFLRSGNIKYIAFDSKRNIYYDLSYGITGYKLSDDGGVNGYLVYYRGNQLEFENIYIVGDTLYATFPDYVAKMDLRTLTDNNVDEKDKIELTIENGIRGFTGLDYNTGYGYIAVDLDGTFYRVPFVEDSKLDFPNSFYYQLLSLMLAVEFKIKQGADPTLLSQQLSSYWSTFYDTLSKDVCDYPRIKNFY